METVYDWITVGIFAGLIVLFLQRSSEDDRAEVHDPLVYYLVAGAGCALTNYLGNKGHDIGALAALGATLAFIALVLKPFRPSPKG